MCRPSRPLTHDLLRDVITRARASRWRRCTSPSCATTSSTPSCASPAACVVSARPSDAIALALRCEVAILGTEAVLDAAGIEIPDEQEDEVEKFREFLDKISPEDFASGG